MDGGPLNPPVPPNAVRASAAGSAGGAGGGERLDRQRGDAGAAGAADRDLLQVVDQALEPPADLVVMDAPRGCAVGATAHAALANGDLPGIAGVMVDGRFVVGRSRNTVLSERSLSPGPSADPLSPAEPAPGCC